MNIVNSFVIKTKSNYYRGFTLIEVMLVIVVIGFMASMVQFTGTSNQAEKMLEDASKRFVGIFGLASDYALLNNIELGLVVTENSYQFVGFNGEKWQEIPEQSLLGSYEVKKGIILSLSIEGIELAEPALYDKDTFKFTDPEDEEEEQELDENGKPKKPKITPLVYILSGGDITPFILSFTLDNEKGFLSVEDEELIYKVTGIYSLPLTIEDPNNEQ